MTIFSGPESVVAPLERAQIVCYYGLGAHTRKKWEKVGAFEAVQKNPPARRKERIKHDDDALIDFLDL